MSFLREHYDQIANPGSGIIASDVEGLQDVLDTKQDVLLGARVRFDGSVLSGGEGLSVTKFAVGTYDIAFDVPISNTDYRVTCQAEGGNDDRGIYLEIVTPNGFRIRVRQEDNGVAADTLVDATFNFNVVY